MDIHNAHRTCAYSLLHAYYYIMSSSSVMVIVKFSLWLASGHAPVKIDPRFEYVDLSSQNGASDPQS